MDKTKEAPLKPYRNPRYDDYDRLYANHVRPYGHAQFNLFTQGLLDETHISRFQLLDAIYAYNKSAWGRTHPLMMAFDREAFNYKAYALT
jgi:hypothetical protein